MIAIVMQIFGNEKIWCPDTIGLVWHDIDQIIGDWVVHRCTQFLPVGKELVQCRWFKYSAGKYMSADLRAFFD